MRKDTQNERTVSLRELKCERTHKTIYPAQFVHSLHPEYNLHNPPFENDFGSSFLPYRYMFEVFVTDDNFITDDNDVFTGTHRHDVSSRCVLSRRPPIDTIVCVSLI